MTYHQLDFHCYGCGKYIPWEEETLCRKCQTNLWDISWCSECGKSLPLYGIQENENICQECKRSSSHRPYLEHDATYHPSDCYVCGKHTPPEYGNFCRECQTNSWDISWCSECGKSLPLYGIQANENICQECERKAANEHKKGGCLSCLEQIFMLPYIIAGILVIIAVVSHTWRVIAFFAILILISLAIAALIDYIWRTIF